MACEVCQHCQGPVTRHDVTIREGFSYHKKCHKCYVCSETNLQNAEVFKGVIFCSSCSQRIFRGCSTARRGKTASRQRRTRSKSHHKRREHDKTRANERRPQRPKTNGVIELVKLAASTDSDRSIDRLKDQPSRPSKVQILSPVLVSKEINNNYHDDYYGMKKDSTEMGVTTDITQELLKQMNCPLIAQCKEKITPPSKPHRRKREHRQNKTNVSDLRIAELGASTEIANMALRNKYEMPVIIKSDARLKEMGSLSLSMLNQESDVSGDANVWTESAYSTVKDVRPWVDRRIGSILMYPYKLFKKNILTRSSLISVLMSTEDNDRIKLRKKIKQLFREEIAEHQHRGIKRLYSTINRRKMPNKLGWLKVTSNSSNHRRCHQCAVYHNKCKHLKMSHSYRCMRSQVMKLAGPTKSELAVFRSKAKTLCTPSFLKNVIACNRKYAAIMMSEACGNSDIQDVKKWSVQ